MTTFKICLRTKRTDNLYPIYIRITQNRRTGYIKTGKLIDKRKNDTIPPAALAGEQEAHDGLST